MPFSKGQSGNIKGRPRQTAEQKEQKVWFKALLKEATVPALESIIAIASDEHNKDCLNACKYIIDKAYGAGAVLLTEDNVEPFTIHIVRHSAIEKSAWEDEWEDE